jgi:diguanylate cyclase (GGDEF)-like protein
LDADLLHSLIADCAVAVAFCALLASLSAVSRHPALHGAILYAAGHVGFTAGTSLFILMLDAGIPASQRPWIAWGALLASASGCAAMVDGMARLLEHAAGRRIAAIAWGVAAALIVVALLPWRVIDPLKLASDLTNTLGMVGLAAVLLRPLTPPYRVPALVAGACTAVLAPLYFGGSVQEWTGSGPVLVPPYVTWMWLDLALWNTLNLCVMMLASFRALVVFVRRSRTDALTHCLNRSGLEDELAVRAVRTPAETPVVVLALDIDHFKAINDRCGHATGDAYLARFAQTLQGCVRQSDLVARIGGEEFVAVLVDAHPEAGERVAAKVLDAIRRLDVECDGQQVRTTVSIGLSSGFGLTSTEALIRRADRALYAAKGSGRDRMSTAGAGETTGAGAALSR